VQMCVHANVVVTESVHRAAVLLMAGA
jgi:hypothetical protein